MAKDKRFLITLSSAAVFDGEIKVAGETVECDESTAKGLLHRGKGTLAEGKPGEADHSGDADEKVLAEHTVDELRHIADEYGIDGVSSLKKAELIAAIETHEAANADE